jgi:hypothetical protein
MPYRLVEQRRHGAFHCRQIADEQRDRARGLGQGNAQRTRMTDYRRVIDNALHGAHGPIRKTLEPQYPCEKRGSDDPLVILKAYGMRPANGSDIASEVGTCLSKRTWRLLFDKDH